MRCTLCHTPLHEKADDLFFICSNCGAYVKNTTHYLSAEEEKTRYDLHGDSKQDEGYLKFTQPLLEAILADVPATAKGLDFGCGRQPALPEILEQKGYSIHLYDPFYFPNKKVFTQTYDFIYCCEVVEHFYHPANEFETLIQLLQPGGGLYIMTMLYDGKTDFRNWHYRRDPTHVFIFTEKTISYLCNKFHLRLQSLKGRLIVLQKSN
jgi:SAM-dependent methyltransferase